MTRITGRDYQAIDADNHYYETEDAFTRHLDPAFASVGVRLDRSGPTPRWIVGRRQYSFTTSNYVDSAPAPGSRADFFGGKKEAGLPQNQPVPMVDPHEHAEFTARDARLALMDEQGLEAIVQLPTTACMIEHDFSDDPAGFFANLRSFNRWLEEEWGYGADGRIFGVPVLSLLDVDLAVQELERVAERGARMIYLKTGPVAGRSPASDHFDPFWARVEETGIAPVFHATNSGYTEMIGTKWGEAPNPFIGDYSAFQMYACYGTRPISDTLAALVLGNLFGRFPRLRVLSIEYGSEWVPPLLNEMDKAAKMASSGSWPWGRLDDDPSDIFAAHVSLTPFHEDDIGSLLEVLPAKNVLFGSDYPHSEGLAKPLDFMDHLPGDLPDDVERAIMRGNIARVLGLAA